MSDLARMEFLQRFGPSDVANASGSMPFRRLSASPARCGAVTRSGAQCAINAGSSLRDGSGKLVSEPLRHGGPHCMFHDSEHNRLIHQAPGRQGMRVPCQMPSGDRSQLEHLSLLSIPILTATPYQFLPVCVCLSLFLLLLWLLLLGCWC